MKKPVLLLFILVMAAGLAASGGTGRAERERECKITVEGGYASELTSYGRVDYYWDVPKDQRIVRVSVRKKTYYGAYTDSSRNWNELYYKGETSDGKITYQCRDSIDDDVTECTVTAIIETRPPMSPLVFNLQKGVCTAPQNEPEGLLYEWTSYSMSELFYNSGLKHDDRAFPYTSYDLDGDGTWDVALSSTAYFYPVYGEFRYTCPGLLIPLPGRSVSGSTTVNLSVSPEQFYDWYYQYGESVPVTFLFDEAETQPEYSITVSGGYAESANEDRTVFTKVIKAAPGTPIRLSGDLLEGEYVSSWTGEYWSVFNRTDNDPYTGGWFYMPAADVTMTAVHKTQKPYTIRLTGGYSKLDESPLMMNDSVWESLTESLGIDPKAAYQVADIDENGTPDIACADFYSPTAIFDFSGPFYFIPLGTCSITGEYTVTAPNRGPYWPITFRFAKEPPAQKYTLTVRGGFARNRDYEPVSQSVAPGTPLYIVWDKRDEDYYYNFLFREDKPFMYSPGNDEVLMSVPANDNQGPFTANFIMPAFDITLTFADWEGEDDPPSVTPTPDELTPAPTEPVVSPSPTAVPTLTTEATPSPLPTDAATPDAAAEQTNNTTSDKNTKRSGNLLPWILIPCAAVLAGLGAFVFIKARKKTNKEITGGSYDSEAESTD